MKLWVFEKAKRIWKGGNIKYEYSTNHGKGIFNVKDPDDKENYKVTVDEWLKTDCSCVFGISHGVKGRKCPHEVAVTLYLTFKNLNEKDVGMEPEFSRSERKELTSSQKRKLRDILTCEICGKKNNIQLHRINRGGKYQLRNIMPLCKKHHKQIHYKEKGMRNK